MAHDPTCTLLCATATRADRANDRRQKVSKMASDWEFVHNVATDGGWTDGLRQIFDYRDLGIADATGGDFVAHIVRANGREQPDDVQQWHVHDCKFQFVQVLEGWAKFEYEGIGVRTLRKGDCINRSDPLVINKI